MRVFKANCIAVAVCSALLSLSATAADTTRFDFAGNLSAATGPGTLGFYNGATTSDLVSFGSASSFGLPTLPGGTAQVMSFPGFAPNQGLVFHPNVPANGDGAFINRYTVIWDLLVPNITGYMGLIQTNDANSNDGDYFIRGDGGIGISGVYQGQVNENTWHRIAMVWDGINLHKYIDGNHVGTQVGLSGTDGRWSMYPGNSGNTYFLTDNNGETLPGYVNSIFFMDDALKGTSIAAIGGPSAGGVDLTGITLEFEEGGSGEPEPPLDFGLGCTNPQPLQFGSDGIYRVMQFADIQDDHFIEPRSTELMEKALDTYQPDLVVFSGDNITGGAISSDDNVRRAIDLLVAPIEKRSIPFFITFGNHDEDSCGGNVTMCEPEQLEYYRSFSCNVNPADDPNVHGDADAVVLVYGPGQPVDRRDPKAAVWVLDSGRYAPNPDAVGGQRINGYSNTWDYIRQDQVAWYKTTSERFERVFGKKVPGLMFFHIPLFEFDMMWSDDFGLPGAAENQDAIDNPVRPAVSGSDAEPFNRHGIDGERNECVCTGPFNSGLFSAARERGDVVSMSVGHDHINSYSGNYHGIQLSYAASAGFGTYGLGGADNHRLRGVRLFDVDLARIEAGDRLPFDTYMALAGEDLGICIDANIATCPTAVPAIAAARSGLARSAQDGGNDAPSPEIIAKLSGEDCNGDGTADEADRACLFEVKHGEIVGLTARALELLK